MPTDLSLIERYGSFGLLAVLFLGFAFYVVPFAIKNIREICDRFTSALEADRKSREESDRAVRSAIHEQAVAMGAQTEAIRALVDRVEGLEDHVAGCPSNKPLPPRKNHPER